jgi:deoxyribodipyrimidine photo-lyase
MSPLPESNDESIRKHETFGKLFEATPVPDSLEGFEVDNKEELSEVWPEGTEKAKEVSQPLVTRTDIQILGRFLYTKTRKEQFKFVSPLADGAVEDKKDSRIQEYATGRNLVGGDYSSKLSPYLTSGVISGRMVCNEAKKVGKGGKLESGRDTGVGMWVQEVSLLFKQTVL